ncbi:hypothetical protein A8B82_03345 [Sulfitobacter sp. EhC04]|uniref:hypothetical protein n=1 Tax=Sulfitobacter sp. EhC04 TaxID=1849168 RepID=UPI0007F40208|nr:hypothetical protein [Sulfitobacter sp. EhC04]OAN71348.1 hypothetical protein A8B82_03345 [Sulfitobacter sp. EhC04]
MLGVVLWSDPVDRKAVFWCEDQGDLAFYAAGPATDPCDGFLDAGDMVTFSTDIVGKLRKARDVTLVQEQVCADLPEKLRDTSQAPAKTPAGGKRILSFVSPSVPQVVHCQFRKRNA